MGRSVGQLIESLKWDDLDLDLRRSYAFPAASPKVRIQPLPTLVLRLVK